MALNPIANGDVSARAKINAAFVAIDGEIAARTEAVANEASARLAADAAETGARLAADTGITVAIPGDERPGDWPDAYTTSLAGGPASALPARSAADTAIMDFGKAIRVLGAGIVARRGYFAVEPNRRYAVRFALSRASDTNDPAGDGVRFAIAWYGGDQAALTGLNTQSVVDDRTNITVASGRVVVTAVVGSVSGSPVTIVHPAAARYARPYAQCYGGSVSNDVEVIDWQDITDAGTISPNIAAAEARITAIEGANLPARVMTLESEVTAPDLRRFQTRSDFIAAADLTGLSLIETLGYASAGDGESMRYKRVLSGADETGADGSLWQILPDEQRIAVAASGTLPSTRGKVRFVVSGGPHTLTFGPVAGYHSQFMAHIVNASADKPQVISLASQRTFCLFPKQSILVLPIGGFWYVMNEQRWRPGGGITHLYSDFSIGTDAPGFGFGSGSAAFKTSEYAYYFALHNFDWSGLSGEQTQAVINAAAGVNDTQGLHLASHGLRGAQGGAAIKIKGGAGAQITKTTGSGTPVEFYFGTVLQLEDLALAGAANALSFNWGSKGYIKGIKLLQASPGGGSGLIVQDGGHCEMYGDCQWQGSYSGAVIRTDEGSAFQSQGFDWTATGNSTFGSAFAKAETNSVQNWGGSTVEPGVFAHTGKRFELATGGRIIGTGANASFFPGTVAGSGDGTGSYV